MEIVEAIVRYPKSEILEMKMVGTELHLLLQQGKYRFIRTFSIGEEIVKKFKEEKEE